MCVILIKNLRSSHKTTIEEFLF